MKSAIEYPLTDPCPCGSGDDYAECCRPAHCKHAMADTAEKLMRSRYSAFVLKMGGYLLQTWHPANRPKRLDLSDDSTCWTGLEIIARQAGGVTDKRGKVEFKAFYRTEDGRGCLHELSRFRRENGLWFYLDGKIFTDTDTLL